MATYYSQGSGNWSTLSNWDTTRDGSGTDPASVAAMDGQFFYIQPGHTVIFDVEDAPACDGSISGWSTTGIAQITIEGGPSSAGVLQFSATPNTPGRIYGLRIRNATNGIQGTANTVLGSIVGGSAESPIPTNAITTISGYGSLINTTYVSVMLYGVGPSEPVYRLTAPANAGDTILYVEGLRSQTNPQSETEWSAGRRVMTNTGITTLHGTTPVAYSGSTLQIDMWMKKDTNAMIITPRAVLLLYTEDEWTQVPLDEYVMTDNTDEQEYTLEYDNSSGVSDLALYLRVYGSNSTGKLYWTYSNSGGGGTASRGHPAIGSVGGMLQ